MQFEHPSYFYLEIIALALCIYLYTVQSKSIKELFSIAKQPSSLTIFHRWPLWSYMVLLFISLSLLIFLLARPYRQTMVESSIKSSNVYLVIDSSFSMYGQDVITGTKAKPVKKSRFTQAKKLARKIVIAAKARRIGLVSFSGTTVIHSGPTTDHESLKELIADLNIHMFYSTGSNLKQALQRLLQLAQEKKETLQAIILSDGEVPDGINEMSAINNELDLLATNKVVVHTIAIGSENGADIFIYDPRKLREGVQEVAQKAHTKREDKYLEKISDKTGGLFFIDEKMKSIKPIITAIKNNANAKSIESLGRTYYLFLPILLLLLLYCFDILLQFTTLIEKINISILKRFR